MTIDLTCMAFFAKTSNQRWPPTPLEKLLFEIEVLESSTKTAAVGNTVYQEEQKTILYGDMLTDEMAGCIVQIYLMTGCDSQVSMTMVRNRLMPNCEEPVARRLLCRCGYTLGPGNRGCNYEPFQLTQHFVYAGNKSSIMTEARAAKWKTLKNKLIIRLPPDTDSHITWRILCASPPRSTTARHPSMAGWNYFIDMF